MRKTNHVCRLEVQSDDRRDLGCVKLSEAKRMEAMAQVAEPLHFASTASIASIPPSISRPVPAIIIETTTMSTDIADVWCDMLIAETVAC